MKAIQVLMDEHIVIGQVIKAMETAAGRLSSGEELRPAFFLNAALFIKNYADGCHHRKEEDILFAAMNAAGDPDIIGPVAVMHDEHVQAREFAAAMKAAAEGWEKGAMHNRSVVAHNALGYARLLYYHIQKEDKLLFPMAEKTIPADKQVLVDAGFEKAADEENRLNIQEKFRALAEVLVKESTQKIAS